jgi:hypothetical protein
MGTVRASLLARQWIDTMDLSHQMWKTNNKKKKLEIKKSCFEDSYDHGTPIS